MIICGFLAYCQRNLGGLTPPDCHDCIKPLIMSSNLGMSEISSAYQYPCCPLPPCHGAGLHFQAACWEGVPRAWVLADEMWTENYAEDPKTREIIEQGRSCMTTWSRAHRPHPHGSLKALCCNVREEPNFALASLCNISFVGRYQHNISIIAHPSHCPCPLLGPCPSWGWGGGSS